MRGLPAWTWRLWVSWGLAEAHLARCKWLIAQSPWRAGATEPWTGSGWTHSGFGFPPGVSQGAGLQGTRPRGPDAEAVGQKLGWTLELAGSVGGGGWHRLEQGLLWAQACPPGTVDAGPGPLTSSASCEDSPFTPVPPSSRKWVQGARLLALGGEGSWGHGVA